MQSGFEGLIQGIILNCPKLEILELDFKYNDIKYSASNFSFFKNYNISE